MQFSTNIGKLTDDDHENIMMIWQQIQTMSEEMEDEIRKLKQMIEEMGGTNNE